MWRREFKTGDPVVYSMEKHSDSPGPRARNVHPAPRGEFYSYVVDKLWIVEEQLGDGRLRLRTRRGKERLVDSADPMLRAPTLWERLRFRSRFPTPLDRA